MNKITILAFFMATILMGRTASATSPFINKAYQLDEDSLASISNCKKCMLATDITDSRIIMVDVLAGKIIWEWKPNQSNIEEDHIKWFKNFSEVKPVYENKYILTTSSGGAVALIRIADKKAVFYAYAGGNTHSAELFPDGNIVSASSTGNFLTVFKVDTTQFNKTGYAKNIFIESGHNVVWDRKNQLLWSTSNDKLFAYSYNFNCDQPDLLLKHSYPLIGSDAHDLFPIYGQNGLWLSTSDKVYRFDISRRKLTQAKDVKIQNNIKSISSGSKTFPIIFSKPKESWWTDEILDANGQSIFYQKGLKIYKARWMLPNAFSYPARHGIRVCQIKQKVLE